MCSIDYKLQNMFPGLSVILCPENSMTLHYREHDGADPQYCCQVPVPEFLVGKFHDSLVAFSTVHCIISYIMKPVFILNIFGYNLQFKNWTNGMKDTCSLLSTTCIYIIHGFCRCHVCRTNPCAYSISV